MGCEELKKQTKDQLAKRIRAAAKTTSNIIITVHAKQQMKKRKVTSLMLYECLQLGQILREPEENFEKGTLECRMERYCAGCNCTAIVALDDNNPHLICVTVWV